MSASKIASKGPIGFVGLGVMGSPMSRHLLENGWRVVGHDPAEAAIQRHVGNGGEDAPNAAALRGTVNIAVTSLPSAGALFATLDAWEQAGDGSPLTIIEASTLTLAEKLAAQARAAAAGMTLLDAPVSGTSAQAERGDLIIYLSGASPNEKEQVAPLLRDMTRAVHHLGEFGNGTRLKLVANLLVAVHNASAAEALLLADRAGLDLDIALPALVDGAGTSRMLELRGPLMVTGAYEPATARVEMFRKDLRAIRELVDDVASPAPLLSSTMTLYDAAAGQGRLDQDTASVYATLRRMAGLDEHTPSSDERSS